MLELPGVALFAVDTVAHDLTRLAIADSIAQARFGRVVVFSDRDIGWGDGVEYIPCPTFASREEAASFSDGVFERYLDRPGITHCLYQQWDSWIVDAREWRDEFLDVDYIGAPWWYRDGLNVGNGGFCLVSARLTRFLGAHAAEFPLTAPGDETLCRVHRPALEQRGFRWAPEPLARRFAFEHSPDGGATFGFHGLMNWPRVLFGERMSERLALANDYVRRHPHWKQMRWAAQVRWLPMSGPAPRPASAG